MHASLVLSFLAAYTAHSLRPGHGAAHIRASTGLPVPAKPLCLSGGSKSCFLPIKINNHESACVSLVTIMCQPDPWTHHLLL